MSILKKLIHWALHPGSLLRQWGLLKEYVLFRSRYGFLHAPRRGGRRGTIFLVNLSDAPHRAITEGMLAFGIASAGGTPVVLSGKANRWAERYFRALGIDRFLFFDDFTTRIDGAAAKSQIQSFLVNDPSLEKLLSYAVDGVNIGTNALSTVLKRVRKGTVDLKDPAMRTLVEHALTEALIALRASQLLTEEHSPNGLLFNEAGYTPYGELFGLSVTKNMNTAQYVHSQRLDAFTLKRYRTLENMVDPVSLSSASWERVRALTWSATQEETFMNELRKHYLDGTWFDLLRSENKKHKESATVRRELGLDQEKKTAVIFSHVAWDASFFFGKNLFHDYDEWLVETVKVACRNPNLNWVIKLHPDYVWHTKNMHEHAEMRDMIAILANVGSLPDHVKVVPPDTDISTYSFFAITDYCITVRGTIGLECPCFGVPVFTAGTGRYSGLGFTEDSTTREEYLEKMRQLHEWPRLSAERTSLARKHAYALFTLRPVSCSSFTLVPVRERGEVVDHRVAIRARSRENVENDSGLRTIGKWILEGKEEDYIAL